MIRFIVSVPERLTRPLGPLAPFAQVWLLGKVPKFGNIWRKASRIKSVTDDIDTNYKRTLMNGTRNDFYGSVRSLGEGNGAMSLGPKGLLAVWKTAEFSQSARMR